MSPRFRALTGAAAAIVLIAAVPATATVVPDRGMAGVTLGMTHDQVTAKLGQPLTTRRIGDVEFCCRYTFAGAIRSTFYDDRALTEISTTGRAERTARGIGVGSSLRRVLRVFPRTRCDRRSRTTVQCVLTRCRPFRTRLGPLRGLARDTEVTVRHGLVTEIGIAGYFASACALANG